MNDTYERICELAEMATTYGTVREAIRDAAQQLLNDYEEEDDIWDTIDLDHPDAIGLYKDTDNDEDGVWEANFTDVNWHGYQAMFDLETSLVITCTSFPSLISSFLS